MASTALHARPSTDTRRYNTVSIAFHWVIALLIVAQLAGGIIMHKLPFSDFKLTAYALHKAGGLTVLALALGRLGWRLTHRPPPLPAGTPPWQKGASHATHWALYVLMIGVPLLGWLMVSASPKGFATTWFGLFEVPHLPVAKSDAAAETYQNLHKYTAIATIALLVLHVGAALYHHYRLRDRVLWRMAPWVKPRTETP